jgi:ribosomal protein S27AE
VLGDLTLKVKKSKCPKCKNDTVKAHHLATFEDRLCFACLDKRVKKKGKFKEIDMSSDE